MGVFDFMKKKDPLTDWEKTQKTPPPEEEKAWGPNTKEDRERFRREYEKAKSQGEEKGFASKVVGAAAGAAGRAADWTLEREKQLRAKSRTKQEEAEYWKKVADDKFKGARFEAQKKGGDVRDLPPSLQQRFEGSVATGGRAAFDVYAEAEELGIDLMKRIPQRVQRKSEETGLVTWVTEMYTIPKSVAELRLEIIEYKHIAEGAEHEYKTTKALRRAEPFIIGAQMATGAMHGAAKVISASAQSPNLRPVGRGSGSVTPMGIRGGSRLFQAPSPRGSVGGINPVPGAGLEGLRRQMFPGQSQGPTPGSRKLRPF
jgi:hypothetical protein